MLNFRLLKKRKRSVENNEINYFGKWLEKEIKRQGLTNAHVARKGGASPTAIGDVISGRRTAGVKLLKAIAKGLDLPEEEILRQARMLPSSKDMDKIDAEIMHQVKDMQIDEKERVLALIKGLKRFRKK